MIEIYQEIISVISKGERAVLATVISSNGSTPRKIGAKMLIKADGTSIGTVGGGGVERRVQEKAKEVMDSGELQRVNLKLSGEGAVGICGGQMMILLEPIQTPDILYIFGAGHISLTTAKIGKMLGFRIVMIDPRSEYNNNDRFPDADALIVEEYARAFSRLNIGGDSYIVICTHGHTFDEKCLEFSAGTNARYIGMIGSHKKVKEVREHLLEKGIPQQQLDRVHAPIGVDIGAETPEEIALSIVAELIKYKRYENI